MNQGREIACLVLNRVAKWAVDKTRNMEHPGTFRNIPEHSGTSRNMKKLKYFFMKK